MILQNNTYIDGKNLGHDIREVEVGDVKQHDFYPQVKIKRWGNECNLSFRLIGEYGNPTWTEKGNIVTWTDGPITAKFYELVPENETLDCGGFEFEVTIAEKPKDNTIDFSIQHKGLDFLYQPVLTKEEVTAGDVRPDHVVGSYALYHKYANGDYTALGGQNYKSGKAGHIYRPYATDAEDNFTWCEINIEAENNTASITIPQDFVDKAVYPIVVDPTFGDTSCGSTYYTINGDWAAASKFTAPEGALVSNIKCCCQRNSSPNRNFKGVIWEYAGACLSATVHTKVAHGSATSCDDYKGWDTSTFASPPTLAGSTDYMLGLVTQYGNVRFYKDTGSGFCSYTGTPNSYSSPGDLKTSGGGGSGSNYRFCVYVTYEAAAIPEALDTKLHFRNAGHHGVMIYDINDEMEEYVQIYTEDDVRYITIAEAGETDLTINKGGTTYKFDDVEFYGNEYDRGIFAGGYISGTTDDIEYITISTLANAIYFGDLQSAKADISACSNATGDIGVLGGNSGYTNVIDYITISTTGNASNFGDLTIGRLGPGACSNGTGDRGIFAGGSDGGEPGETNVVDYITISTPGDATNFGDLTVARQYIAGTSNRTNNRGVFAGGTADGPVYYDNMDYITISSTSDATVFGDLTETRFYLAGVSNGTSDRGVYAGGKTASRFDTIDYITISTPGNATDFGNLTNGGRFALAGCSNTTSNRGVFGGGNISGAYQNTIDYITINSAGNATDFGDLVNIHTDLASTSNS